MGEFYSQLAEVRPTINLKREKLLLARKRFEEAFRIYLKMHGPTHLNAVEAAYNLAKVDGHLKSLT